ncbi:MAG: flavodoxin-dependent (E)-4-hydroxy-3-methylbut-2-enyl-diphosphate synthase [Ruminococcaceae bacterium]|nr:flavodoxin-dependent (E)-4-hydroxy-3-methylbut-2-enyl-diphosphate synthase [Oscillospiraceae bacterium]
MNRNKTRAVKVGNTGIGGAHKIAVQSMLCTPNGDMEAALRQTTALAKAGCDLVRLAVINDDSLRVVEQLKKKVDVPLVADIQFDYRLALSSIDAGIDKIRLNPGNIGNQERVRMVVEKAKYNSIPIRVGVNAGSVSQSLLKQYGAPCAEALVEEALGQVRLLEDCDFHDIVISLKASSVPMMIDSYRLMSQKVDYPLHLGVTEAGTIYSGTVKSAVGIGALLSEGIGDTIRVSLTADPVEEIKAANEILSALELKKDSAKLVSCPTCARCTVDLISIANRVTERLSEIKKPVKIAVMGCVVNGPGEARDADIGITGAKGEGLIFKQGTVIRRVPEEEIVTALFEELDAMGALA